MYGTLPHHSSNIFKKKNGFHRKHELVLFFFMIFIFYFYFYSQTRNELKNLSMEKITTDVCKNHRYFSLDSLSTCIHSIPLDTIQQSLLLSNIKKLIPSYIFSEISKKNHTFGNHSNNDIFGIDLMEKIQQIELKQYKHDYMFQQDLFNVFKHLKDAHTTYRKPPPYRYFYALQPIIFRSVWDAKQKKQFLRFFSSNVQEEIDAYDKLYNPKLASLLLNYSGWNIIQIDGRNSMDVLKEFTLHEIGLLKDFHSRFHLSVSGFGNERGFFLFRSMSSFLIPSNSSIVYTLQHPQQLHHPIVQIKIQWMGCNGLIPSSSIIKKTKKFQTNKVKHFFSNYMNQLHDHDFLSSSSSSSKFTSVTSQLIEKKKKKILFLKISSFSPSPQEEIYYSEHEWLTKFTSTISTALSNPSINELFIDLRGNGGGDICLGYALLNYLFPSLHNNKEGNHHLPHQQANYHMKSNNLLSLYAQEAARRATYSPSSISISNPWHPNLFFNSKNHRQYCNVSWYLDHEIEWKKKQLGNQITQSFYLGCMIYYLKYFEAPGTSFKGLKSSHVYLISNGLCGSTCAIFSSFIQSFHLGQTITIQTYPHPTQQQFFSFPGGEVSSMNALIQQANDLQLNLSSSNSILLKELEYQADFSFALLAIEPWKTLEEEMIKPLEYVFMPSKYHIAYQNDEQQNQTKFYLHLIDNFANVSMD